MIKERNNCCAATLDYSGVDDPMCGLAEPLAFPDFTDHQPMDPSGQKDKRSARPSGQAVQWLLGDPVSGGRAERQSYAVGKMRAGDYPDFNEPVSPQLPGPPPESLTLCNAQLALDGVEHRSRAQWIPNVIFQEPQGQSVKLHSQCPGELPVPPYP